VDRSVARVSATYKLRVLPDCSPRAARCNIQLCPFLVGRLLRGRSQQRRLGDPPPLKWSDLKYVFDIKEDSNGKEAIQA
jgi:hypothetical protein